MASASKPVPVPDERSAPFWAAAAEGRLVLQRCGHCGWLAYPPKGLCGGCHDLDPSFEFVEAPGSGKVSTWTVVRDAFLPGFVDEVPYVVADVSLDAHPEVRILARVVGVDPEQLHLGFAVDLDFESVADGVAVPFFRPAEVR